LCYSLVYLCMCAFAVLDLVSFLYYAKRLARKNVSEMAYFVSTGTQNLNSIDLEGLNVGRGNLGGV